MNEIEYRHRYSFIYKELVENPSDFVGLVAYSLYKQEKIAYVCKFEEENGRPPDPYELKDFHTQSKIRLDSYKEMAEVRVSNFCGLLLKTKSEELEEDYKQRLTAELKTVKPSWWLGVCQSIIGSVLYTILIGILVLSVLYSQYGLGWVIDQCVNKMEVIQ